MHLIEEVEQIVSRAAAVGGTLQIGRYAKRLQSSLAGFSEKSIADELIRAAARAGIPIEISSGD
jgi:hypothetical protein